MILVTFAIPFESANFRAKIAGQTGISCLHTGVGSVAARRAIEVALNSGQFSHVIASGFAGGLVDGLAIGDLVTIGPNEFGGQQLSEFAQSVRLLESDDVLVDPSQKRAFADRTGAEAVDMETATILEVCRRRAVPAVALRVISDDVRSSLVVPSEILTDAARRPIIGTLRLLGYLFVRPTKWWDFKAMIQHCNQARESLANGLRELTNQIA